MSEVSKPVRLSKVAREFNLGVDSIVEFLASQGIEVERKPNTKLEPEQYALVRSNFADEKAAKEKSKQKSKTCWRWRLGSGLEAQGRSRGCCTCRSARTCAGRRTSTNAWRRQRLLRLNRACSCA